MHFRYSEDISSMGTIRILNVRISESSTRLDASGQRSALYIVSNEDRHIRHHLVRTSIYMNGEVNREDELTPWNNLKRQRIRNY